MSIEKEKRYTDEILKIIDKRIALPIFAILEDL